MQTRVQTYFQLDFVMGTNYSIRLVDAQKQYKFENYSTILQAIENLLQLVFEQTAVSFHLTYKFYQLKQVVAGQFIMLDWN